MTNNDIKCLYWDYLSPKLIIFSDPARPHGSRIAAVGSLKHKPLFQNMKKEKSRIKMKKLLSLSLVVILLLSLPLPALSANENQKSVNNDASMVFVLGATGSYSTALGEVVDGKRSVTAITK